MISLMLLGLTIMYIVWYPGYHGYRYSASLNQSNLFLVQGTFSALHYLPIIVSYQVFSTNAAVLAFKFFKQHTIFLTLSMSNPCMVYIATFSYSHSQHPPLPQISYSCTLGQA